jgi:hypothetical protein
LHCREFPRGAVYAKVFATDATFQPEMSWLNAEADWNVLPCLQMPSGCYRTMRYPRYSYSAARASRQFSCCPWHVTTQEWAVDGLDWSGPAAVECLHFGNARRAAGDTGGGVPATRRPTHTYKSAESTPEPCDAQQRPPRRRRMQAAALGTCRSAPLSICAFAHLSCTPSGSRRS